MDSLADVFFNDTKVGQLSKGKEYFKFEYDEAFFNSEEAFPISYSFPLTQKQFLSKKLFPFFEGLVAEGWLLKLQSQSLKIDEKDYFSMLLANGEDLIGGVKVKKVR